MDKTDTMNQSDFERLSQLMADKGVRHEAFELLADLRMSERNFAEKATAYDRLMSGGKKTLKEIANFLGNPVAVDREGRLLWFPRKPEIGLTTWIWYDKYLPKNIFDYTGDWKDSLTLPDEWEEK